MTGSLNRVVIFRVFFYLLTLTIPLFNYVNIMYADSLAPCVARTSAAMILIIYDRQVPVLLEEEFPLPESY